MELYGKAVKNCICLIDGRILPESELLDSSPSEKSSGKKKNKQVDIEERMKSIAVQVLIPEVTTAVYLVRLGLTDKPFSPRSNTKSTK